MCPQDLATCAGAQVGAGDAGIEVTELEHSIIRLVREDDVQIGGSSKLLKLRCKHLCVHVTVAV